MYKCFFNTGVYLSLNKVVYPNNTFIPITKIGRSSSYSSKNALLCVTDKRPCCSSVGVRIGEWFFPDGAGTVPILDNANTFYRNRRDDGSINLNRLSDDVMMPTGKFCCVVPDATNTNVTLCANIGKCMFTVSDY